MAVLPRVCACACARLIVRDLETWTMRRPRPQSVWYATRKSERDKKKVHSKLLRPIKPIVLTPYGIQNRNFCGLLSLYSLTKCVNYLLCTANERSLIITNTIVHSTNVYSKFIKRNRTDNCTYRYVNLMYYIQCSLLHVSVTYCDHLQGGVLWRNITERRNSLQRSNVRLQVKV